MIAAMAFFPIEEVINSWEELLIILQLWILLQQQNMQQKLDNLLTYFEINYIGHNIA
ncbi:hypothetical protein BgiBS90_016926, partial [Biomphalaria glabrata]